MGYLEIYYIPYIWDCSIIILLFILTCTEVSYMLYYLIFHMSEILFLDL